MGTAAVSERVKVEAISRLHTGTLLASQRLAMKQGDDEMVLMIENELQQRGATEGVGIIPLHREPTAKAGPSAVEQIAAILARPNVHFFGDIATNKAPDETTFDCGCIRCRAIRWRGMICPNCGFDGEPLVGGCDCREGRASNIENYTRIIAEHEAGIPNAYTASDIGFLRRELAKVEARPDRMCLAHRDKEVRNRRHGGPYCAHGEMWCPTCGTTSSGLRDGPEADSGSLAALIAEVRVVLQAALAGEG